MCRPSLLTRGGPTPLHQKKKIPNKYGAIDGRHMLLANVHRRAVGFQYFNYKGFFSIVLMTLADYKFIWADDVMLMVQGLRLMLRYTTLS